MSLNKPCLQVTPSTWEMICNEGPHFFLIEQYKKMKK